MENLKEILYNNAKINSCEHIIKTYPFLEKTILEAMNQALHIHDIVGRSEQSSKIIDGECMICGDVADTKDGWTCSDCRHSE